MCGSSLIELDPKYFSVTWPRVGSLQYVVSCDAALQDYHCAVALLIILTDHLTREIRFGAKRLCAPVRERTRWELNCLCEDPPCTNAPASEPYAPARDHRNGDTKEVPSIERS